MFMESRTKHAKKIGRNIVKFHFWRIPKAFTNEEYNQLLTHLDEHNKSAAEWIKASNPNTWATSKFIGETYGHITSNMAETFNQWILKARFLPIFAMLESIRILLMKLFCERRDEALHINKEVRPYTEAKIAEAVKQSKDYNVYTVSNIAYEVRDANNWRLRVDLSSNTCKCLGWQKLCLPLTGFTSWIHLRKYNTTCKRRRVGRPKVKRRRSEAKEKRVMHCSICKESGHTKKRCGEAPS
ncbi:hypothetical protein GIB67_024341 [Kingdonia uniflora]|uniref:Uncharacterized protein n=1 Tax=Kingdonia uniflora TaxID=39325 RepID=A0A7J7LF52_9MAGN|nr:hypothetical protein GIB67_024341 [Kingdonia uniflora]